MCEIFNYYLIEDAVKDIFKKQFDSTFFDRLFDITNIRNSFGKRFKSLMKLIN